MSKVFLLGANKEIDRAKQVVEVNQIIQMESYNNDKYVVYDILKRDWGIAYKLICLRTKEFLHCGHYPTIERKIRYRLLLRPG